ncbi:hypothetical protein, partial [Bradyrhizobium vignae]
ASGFVQSNSASGNHALALALAPRDLDLGRSFNPFRAAIWLIAELSDHGCLRARRSLHGCPEFGTLSQLAVIAAGLDSESSANFKSNGLTSAYIKRG